MAAGPSFKQPGRCGKPCGQRPENGLFSTVRACGAGIVPAFHELSTLSAVRSAARSFMAFRAFRTDDCHLSTRPMMTIFS